MIYTLTLNPSVDYIIEVKEVHLGELNRLEKTSKFAGGKGINVSKVLKRMGVQSKALGFVGGFTGSFIETQLLAEKIDTDFVKVEEDTRINVKLKADTETELNASGPTISAEKFQALKDKIASLTSEDLLVLAGSVPSTLPKTTYEELVKICHENNVSFVVDAEGELLKAVLPYHPFLIKPNHHELGDLFGTTITNAQEAIPYGKKLVEMGAQNVIVSLAGEGAILISQHEELISTVPKGEVQSSVGAGDSMVAGFLAKYVETQDMKESFRYSIASGSATAFSIGLCTKEKVESLLPQVQLQA
ncbi:1-phosphofructokinase [Niallia sp. Sow4_A1]|jgi:1-phosphofructokinase|uniref:Tagatose-6-phosphate kinase n=1 Tax=Niallia hominis TaxID=3133173 RepID=A0ABV1F1T5_9BACI|nr:MULTISPECIES: 1-phosphofructokinase [Bacillaceae]MCF2649844.1 1-phosphofructokinase [Niallia circulans]MCM3362893.1 1-phosphofructokinase [Niallia sp. MER TA 168]CAI9393509.1 Tagatose-6-phosphate kinase [Bacillus sp. T2.9-1]